MAAEHFIGLLLKHTAEHALDHWHAWATCFGAMLRVARGDTEEGLHALQTILDGLPSDSFFVNYAGIQATLAEALGKTGEISTAHAVIDAALMRSERNEERWYLAEFLQNQGVSFTGWSAARGHRRKPKNSSAARSTALASRMRSLGNCGRP